MYDASCAGYHASWTAYVSGVCCKYMIPELAGDVNGVRELDAGLAGAVGHQSEDGVEGYALHAGVAAYALGEGVG